MAPNPSPTPLPMYAKPGCAVEISSDEPGFRGSWYPGTVIRQSSNINPNKLVVQYTTLFSDESGIKPLREILDMDQLRPPPPTPTPRGGGRDFTVGDEVEAYYNDGWWEGVVTEVLDGGRYSLFFRSSREKIKFGKEYLRVHRDWINGDWKPPLEENGEMEKVKRAIGREYISTCSSEGNCVSLTVDVASFYFVAQKVSSKEGLNKAIPIQMFSYGSCVEVSNDKGGSEGRWLAAKIIEPRGEDRYLVEYRNLKAEDGIDPLREEIVFLNIRPPLPCEELRDFAVGEKVDAYYNDGWWEGVVTEVLEDGRFGVFFSSLKQKIRFGRQGLRLHREWVDGEWKLPLKEEEEEDDKDDEEQGKEKKQKRKAEPGCFSQITKKQKAEAGSKEATAKQEFGNGTLVEVSSDEEGFEGSWFAAKIIEPQGKDKYLVEYKNLKAEDDTPLREVSDVLKIRPEPPETVMLGRFDKREEVDALYNDGWWVGVIYRVLADSKYLVYFQNTGEELKFDHSELRLHQEWINGNWGSTSKSLKL